MLPKLETRSLLSQTGEVGWLATVALTDSNQNQWFAVISSPHPANQVASKLDTAYHQVESNTSDQLYLNLKLITDEFPDLNISAVCVSPQSITVFAYGNTEVNLTRHNQTNSILISTSQQWSAMEGKWQIHDVIQLASRLEIEFQPVIHHNPNLKKRRQVLGLGIIILILLLISIFAGSLARTEQLLQKKFSSLEQQAAQSLAVSQALSATDQVQARAQLRTILDQVNQSKPDFAKKSAYLKKWQQLHDQVNQAFQTIAGETVLDNLPVWYPLDLIKPGLMGYSLHQAGDNLLVWDDTSGTLVKVDPENKRGEIVAGGDSLTGLKSIYAVDSKAVALIPKGIIEINLNKKTTSTLIEATSDWIKPQLVGLFGNNLYLVDPGAYSIWRYPATTAGLGAKQAWLGPGVNLPDVDYQRLAIDGQLWLLQSGGRITRYTRGAPQSFSLSGLDTPLGSKITSFAVHSDQDLLALLDTDNHRVVITTKAGVYQKQVIWPGLSQAQDIALSADAATLYILSQGIIYATPI